MANYEDVFTHGVQAVIECRAGERDEVAQDIHAAWGGRGVVVSDLRLEVVGPNLLIAAAPHEVFAAFLAWCAAHPKVEHAEESPVFSTCVE